MSLLTLKAEDREKLKKILNFKSPLELLLFTDDAINRGLASIYPWQRTKLEEFGSALVNGSEISSDNPYRGILRAANGSGKSKYILAPCVIWMLLKQEALSIVTTASGAQLDTQDERYSRLLAQALNRHFYSRLGEDLIKINHRHFECPLFGSYADFFATDEPNKAEGKHPIVPNGEFAIFIDEAKSISNEIYEAIDRCRGFTRRLEISSPGDQSGYFYDINTNKDTPYKISVVTYRDCPHISVQDSEWMIKKYGLSHPLVRSSLFAEFTSISDNVVIPRNILNKNLAQAKIQAKFGKFRIGLDLSAGGDEICATRSHGNVVIDFKADVIKDTVESTRTINGWFRDWELTVDNSIIFADDGGVGHGIIDQLYHMGWTNIVRMYNQSSAIEAQYYANRGVELWFNFKRFLEEYQVCFLYRDQKLEDQLVNRHFKRQQQTQKLILEKKSEAKANGHPSPDRADSLILSWTPMIYPSNELEIALGNIKENKPIDPTMDEAELIRKFRERIFSQDKKDNNLSADGQTYKKIDGFGINSVGAFLAQQTSWRSKYGLD